MSTTETLSIVERACADLARRGEPITFTQVAAATGLARSTLYRNAALRAVIEHHQQNNDGPLTPLTDQLATLRVAVDTVAERLRSHEEQLRRLQN